MMAVVDMSPSYPSAGDAYPAACRQSPSHRLPIHCRRHLFPKGCAPMPVLDLSPLEAALAALDRGLARAVPAPADEELRDACIQRFEFCFELCWKMLKRRLELDLPSPAVIDGMSYRELFRVGAEQGLVDDPAPWFVYREQRNITSHAYNAAKAAEVFAVIPGFASHAKDLLDRLRARGKQHA